MQFLSNGFILSRQHNHCFCTFIWAFSNVTKESHLNTDSCQVNNHTSGHQRKDGLLWVKRCIQKVNGQMAKEESDCADVNWSFWHKMKDSVLHDSWRRYSLFALRGSGGLICMDGGLVKGPSYTALSWSLSRGRASPLQAGWVLRWQPNCHVNECLAGLHELCVLVEVTSSVQPFTVRTEKAIAFFSSNSCSANV